jgi:hypothetical protein
MSWLFQWPTCNVVVQVCKNTTFQLSNCQVLGTFAVFTDCAKICAMGGYGFAGAINGRFYLKTAVRMTGMAGGRQKGRTSGLLLIVS